MRATQLVLILVASLGIASACGSTEPESPFSTVEPDAGGGGVDAGAPPPNPGCSPPCAPPLRCSSKARCLAAGACDLDVDCEKGKVCDTKAGACVPGGGCGAQTVVAEPVHPNLLIVLDRSCSMTNKVGTQTRWQIAVDALKAMTTTHTGKIRFGLTMFPDTDANQCAQGAIPTPVGPANEAKIQSTLTAALGTGNVNFPDGPCVTNIDTAMSQAAGDPGFTDATRQSFAMLVTDGAQAGCNAGGGDPGTIATLTAMATKGVKTFIVAFGGAVDTASLNQFATAGGMPLSGATKYYNAADKASLDAALQAIAALTGSCTFKLGSVPPDPSKLYVFADKSTQVPRDATKTSGWEYDPATNQVTLYGQACADVKSGKTKLVDIVYGCPDPR